MLLSKLGETSSTITLGWTAVPGAVGYRFTAEKQGKPSHTWNENQTSVKFSKGSGWYKVEALSVKDTGEYPPPAGPSAAYPETSRYPSEKSP